MAKLSCLLTYVLKPWQSSLVCYGAGYPLLAAGEESIDPFSLGASTGHTIVLCVAFAFRSQARSSFAWSRINAFVTNVCCLSVVFFREIHVHCGTNCTQLKKYTCRVYSSFKGFFTMVTIKAQHPMLLVQSQ